MYCTEIDMNDVGLCNEFATFESPTTARVGDEIINSLLR
jgi:hypothetical protein